MVAPTGIGGENAAGASGSHYLRGVYPCGTTNHAPTDSYYTGATNYATRIYLAEGATDAEREAVIGQYDGDASASVSVELFDEKPVSLGPLTFIVSILVTAGTSLLVSLRVARKNRKIDMVEALKGAE